MYDMYRGSLPLDVLQRIVEIDPVYWTQISRTVNGIPVDDTQIQLMAEAIVRALDLQPVDDLLDIGCGNGALLSVLAPMCRSVLGVDPDNRLLDVARNVFGQEEGVAFDQGSLPSDLPRSVKKTAFTKALIYGVFAYVPEPQVSLEIIRELCPSVQTLFIGQVPDAARKLAFTRGVESHERLRHLDATVGRWFRREEFIAMAQRAGWSVEVSIMPHSFYSAHYRFDALLSRVP